MHCTLREGVAERVVLLQPLSGSSSSSRAHSGGGATSSRAHATVSKTKHASYSLLPVSVIYRSLV